MFLFLFNLRRVGVMPEEKDFIFFRISGRSFKFYFPRISIFQFWWTFYDVVVGARSLLNIE